MQSKDMQKLLLRRDVQVASDRHLAFLASGKNPWVPFADAYAVALKRKAAGLLVDSKFADFVASSACTSLDVPGILHFVAERKPSKKAKPKTKAAKKAAPEDAPAFQMRPNLAAIPSVARKAAKRPRDDAKPAGAAAAGAAAPAAKPSAGSKPKKARLVFPDQQLLPMPSLAVALPQSSPASDGGDSVQTVSTAGKPPSRPAAAAASCIVPDEDPVSQQVTAPPHTHAPGTAPAVAAPPSPRAAPGPKEKRSRSFRKTASAKTTKAIAQAKEQRLYVVGERYCSEAGGTFLVWCKGALSKVIIGTECSCSCPVGVKGDVCKHHMFIMLRALGRREDDVLTWQGGLLQGELRELFTERPRPRSNGGKTAASKVATADSNAKRCLVVKGDTCPVCFLPVVKGGVQPLEWCRAYCGQNVHAECMQQKADFHASAQCRVEYGTNDLPCPYCDKGWMAAPGQ